MRRMRMRRRNVLLLGDVCHFRGPSFRLPPQSPPRQESDRIQAVSDQKWCVGRMTLRLTTAPRRFYVR